MEKENVRTCNEVDNYIPDKYEFSCDGHLVNVINTTNDHDEIQIVFYTPEDKEITVKLSMKEAKELRKELKAAITLVKIANDY